MGLPAQLGRAIRTDFLLRYLGSVDLRRAIGAATNKSELFNRYAQWVAFGSSGLATAAERDEQRNTAFTQIVALQRGAAEIGLAAGAVINTYKMAKHFDIAITGTSFTFARRTEAIAAEATTDGLYVVRTSLPAAARDDASTVRSYKSLARVERAFRCLKTVDLQVRPVHHWLADRVRAHVFLCMLAYYLAGTHEVRGKYG